MIWNGLFITKVGVGLADRVEILLYVDLDFEIANWSDHRKKFEAILKDMDMVPLFEESKKHGFSL